jgi:hypothetical protein
MKKFTFSLSESQIKVINDGLMHIAFGLAAPVIEDLNKQIQKQFDLAIDNKDMPTGQIVAKDEFSGD